MVFITQTSFIFRLFYIDYKLIKQLFRMHSQRCESQQIHNETLPLLRPKLNFFTHCTSFLGHYNFLISQRFQKIWYCLKLTTNLNIITEKILERRRNKTEKMKMKTFNFLCKIATDCKFS